MNRSILAALLLCICLFFCACSSKQYSESLPCEDVITVLQDKFFANEQYVRYLSSDIDYMFDSDDITDHCVVYSSSSDDIGEFGVLRAESEEDARELLEDVNRRFEDFREEKSQFLRSYMPNELPKLENAKAKQFGRYVVFSLQSSDMNDKILKEAEHILCQK